MRRGIFGGSLVLSISIIMFAVTVFFAGIGACYSFIIWRKMNTCGTFSVEQGTVAETAEGISSDMAEIEAGPDLGLTLYDVTSTSQQRGLPVGVYVVTSEYCEGLWNGDRILSVGGVDVMSSDGVEGVLLNYQAGDTVNFLVDRNGRMIIVKYTVISTNKTDTTR